MSSWELFSFSYFCSKRDPRPRYKLINYADLYAIRVKNIIDLITMIMFAMYVQSLKSIDN